MSTQPDTPNGCQNLLLSQRHPNTVTEALGKGISARLTQIQANLLIVEFEAKFPRFESIGPRFLCQVLPSLCGDPCCIAGSSNNHLECLVVSRNAAINPRTQIRKFCFKLQNEQNFPDFNEPGRDSFAKCFRHCVVMPVALEQGLTTSWSVWLRREKLQSSSGRASQIAPMMRRREDPPRERRRLPWQQRELPPQCPFPHSPQRRTSCSNQNWMRPPRRKMI